VITGTSRDGPSFATGRTPSQPGQAPEPRSADPYARVTGRAGFRSRQGQASQPHMSVYPPLRSAASLQTEFRAGLIVNTTCGVDSTQSSKNSVFAPADLATRAGSAYNVYHPFGAKSGHRRHP
jgi:hypothetical protein